jgi:hypothetical protein
MRYELTPPSNISIPSASHIWIKSSLRRTFKSLVKLYNSILFSKLHIKVMHLLCAILFS